MLHEDTDGAADGFLIYEISGDWSTGINRKRLRVARLHHARLRRRAPRCGSSRSPSTSWRRSRASSSPVDDPLRFLLADVRRLRVDAVNDGLWVQIIDVERALEARRYSTSDRVVLEVHDGATVTASRSTAVPTVRSARRPRPSPISCSGLSQLGSIYLGGVRAEHHAAVGTIEERTPGAITRVDAMFASYPPPATLTHF